MADVAAAAAVAIAAATKSRRFMIRFTRFLPLSRAKPSRAKRPTSTGN
jgi:hypothetical protein